MKTPGHRLPGPAAPFNRCFVHITLPAIPAWGRYSLLFLAAYFPAVISIQSLFGVAPNQSEANAS
jgi:hypothetical protein